MDDLILFPSARVARSADSRYCMPAMTSSNQISGYLTEVFSSVQGEGPYAGCRQLFIRLYGCHRRCRYCDTPETVTAWQPAGFRPDSFRIEKQAGAGYDRETRSNPLTADELVKLVRDFDHPRGLHHSIVLTGGEPLMQTGFLAGVLPGLKRAGFRTYLETSGDLYHELDKVIAHVDIVAMDIKLPGATGNESAWGGHRHFLKRCRDAGKDVFVKAVVSADTPDRELDQAAAIVAAIDPSIPVILQPLTPFGEADNPPTLRQLFDWQARLAENLTDIRIIPQLHKAMGAL